MKLSGASPAAGKYLRNLEKALKNNGYVVELKSFLAIPGAKEAFHDAKKSDNDQVYKSKWIIRSVIQYHKSVLESANGGDVVVFYNIDYYSLGLVGKLNKRGVKTLLILADHTGSFKECGNVVRWIISKLVEFDIKRFAAGIALSEKSMKYFSDNSKVIVLEGGIDLNCFSNINPPKEGQIARFMYAGTLSKVAGVDVLLKAIDFIKDLQAEFYISGKGELEKEVYDAAKNDSRIKYLGFIPDDEYYKLLNEIDFFINPRNMQFEQNKNNFPSKVLEYLATGRGVISTRFPGFERFVDYFDFYDDDYRALADKICNVLTDGRNVLNVYEKNRNAAMKYDWDIQAQKIVKLVSY